MVYTLASPDAFQSTLPTRGSDHIFPRKKRCLAISIHAPHEGERRLYAEGKLAEYIFQSTLPTRGSDLPVEARTVLIWMISIHAPHEGERPASPQ